MLKNMKIGPRMAISFIIIIILSALMAVISITQTRILAQQTENMYNGPLKVIDNTWNIRRSLYVARANTVEAVIYTEADKIETAAATAAEAGGEIRKAIENLTPIFERDATTERTELLAELSDIQVDAGNARLKAIEFARQNMTSEAMSMYENEYLPLFEEIRLLAIELGETAQVNAERFYTQSVSASHTALVVVAGLAALQILVAVVIAVLLTTSVTRPLGKVKEAAEAVAAGRIDIQIDYQAKDEIGHLADTFRSVIQTLNLLNTEMRQLKGWTMEGRILERAKDDEHIQGAYKDIVAGVNDIMDIFNRHFDALPVGVSIVDTSAHKLFANRTASEHQAIDKDNLLTQTQDFADESGATVGRLVITVDQTSVMEAQRESARQAKAVEEAMRLAQKQSEYQQSGMDAIIESIEELAKGNLKIDMHERAFDEDTKEIHGMFDSLEKNLVNSCTSIRGYIDELAHILGSIARKDLNVGITREYLGDFAELKISINDIADNLNEVFGDIASASSQVQTGSQQVANSSQTLAQGASEQASAVEEISSTITEVATQTKNNAENANRANEISLGAKSDAETGSKQMDEMVSAMEAIREASKGIAGIIKTIEDIAFQTNILALNAAVEAARAGEHGKGFAVVAEEVRTLAARSAAAAKETTEMIDNSLSRVEAGSRIAGDTAEALSKIVSGVTGTVNIVATIAEASAQQAEAIAQIDNGIEQISKVTQSNTATAEESASASEEMAGQAQMLRSMVAEFSLKGQLGTTQRVIERKEMLLLT